MESKLTIFSATTAQTASPAPSARPTYFGFAAPDDLPDLASAAPVSVVAGPRRSRSVKIAAIVLALGVPCVHAHAVAAPPSDDGSLLASAPGARGSAGEVRVSQASPPRVALATPGGVSGAADDGFAAPGSSSGQPWQVELGFGVAAAPKYPGSGQISVTPAPLVSVTYDDRYFVSTRQGIGAYVIRTPRFSLGASIGFDGESRYTGKDARLRGLPKIKPAGQASIFAEYQLGPVAIEAAVHERIGPVNGLSATLGATYRARLTPDWSVMAGPEVKAQSASLNNAFFGVTPEDSLHAAAFGNRIGAYRPGAGIEDVSFTIASQYRASEHWVVMTRAGLGLLVGRDGHSPLTRERLQPELGLFATYRF
jgi:outer membrane protein